MTDTLSDIQKPLWEANGSSAIANQWLAAHEAARRRRYLSLYPEARQTAVAEHYASLAALSRDLVELTRHRLYQNTAEVQEAIDRVERQIRQDHIQAFGCEPAWWPQTEAVEETR